MEGTRKISRGAERISDHDRSAVRRNVDRARLRVALARWRRGDPPDIPPPPSSEPPRSEPAEDEDSPALTGDNYRGSRVGGNHRNRAQKDFSMHALRGLLGGACSPNRRCMDVASARPDTDDADGSFTDFLEEPGVRGLLAMSRLGIL